MLVCCRAIASVKTSSCASLSSTFSVTGSNPSRLTRTIYAPGFKSGATNFPSPSEVSCNGSTRLSPRISMRAPAIPAPEGSFTVPERVAACIQPGNVSHTRTSASCNLFMNLLLTLLRNVHRFPCIFPYPLPRVFYVPRLGIRLSHTKRQRELPVQLRMGQEHIPALVQPVHNRLVGRVSGLVAEANQIERGGRSRF